ncbi:MAG: divalent-cation tolerance protein CutA [SAR324 cluster bacterium]|nr:divalent-cation tolerance protein CutA [SAR324 cluster bacterium]
MNDEFKNDTKLLLVLTNTSSAEEAQKIADAAIHNHFAAAAQIIGPVKSTFRWKGKIENAEEWICLLKSSEPLYESLEETIKSLHSYELPGILTIPVTGGSMNYFQWIQRQLR